jgi:hypothetical protein
MREVIVWGGSGQAVMLNEALFDTDIKIVAVFDNRQIVLPFPNVPFHVGEDGFRSWIKARPRTGDLYFLVAVGGPIGCGSTIGWPMKACCLSPSSIVLPSLLSIPYSAPAARSWLTPRWRRGRSLDAALSLAPPPRLATTVRSARGSMSPTVPVWPAS